MRVIARSTLRRFLDSLRGTKDYTALKAALDAWFHEVRRATWKSPADIKRQYHSASIVKDRVVFNIKGNAYRLVVGINYRLQIVFIKWVGNHAAYDRMNVAEVEYER